MIDQKYREFYKLHTDGSKRRLVMSASEDSDDTYIVSTKMTASGEDVQIRKRKRSINSTPDPKNESIQNRITYLENVVSQFLDGKVPPNLPSALTMKRQKVANDQITCESSPSKVNRTSIRRSSQGIIPVHQKRNTSNTNSPSKSDESHLEKNTNRKDLQYDCRLCEAVFNSKQSRNTHYTGTHAVENEKLLFFPDGRALVESSLEYRVSLKPDWFKAAAKRNMPSKMCKLCKVELDSDDLKWHYENKHKVIQMTKVKPIICLNNSDIKIVAEPFKCKECPQTYDDITRLRVHTLSAHGGMVKCKFCKADIPRKFYNNHVKKEHANMYFKKIRINSKRVIARTHNVNMIKRATQFKCRCCSQKFPTLVAMREHRRAMHKKTEMSENKGKEMPNRHDVETAKVAENQKEQNTSTVPASALAILMYMCDACDLVTTSYDEAVAHSQDHILNIANTTTAHCKHCNLKFGEDYQTHLQLHAIHDDIDLDSFRVVIYDYRSLMTDKWLDMLHFLPQVKIKIIESASVYFSTRRIRLKFHSGRKDASAPFTLFQCVTCNKFVDPFDVVLHVKQQNCSEQPNSYPCDECRRQFYSESVWVQHELTHKVPNAEPLHIDAPKYRTVLFNDQNDVEINKLLLEAAEKGVQNQESNQNVNLENRAKFEQECNQNVNLNNRAKLDQQSNQNINLNNKPKCDKESIQNVNLNNRAKIDQESNQNINSNNRAKVDQENNQNINSNNRAKVDQESNQIDNFNNRAKPDQESNQNVNLENRTKVKNTQNVVTVESDISSNDEITNVHKLNEDQVATVYRCKCELCFDQFKCLFEHLEICTNTLGNETVKCKCGLVFNKENYSYHNKIHCSGYTRIQVKEIIVREGEKIDIDEKVQPEYNRNDSSLNLDNGIKNINKENSNNLNAPLSIPNQVKLHNSPPHVGSETKSNKNAENFGNPMNLRDQQPILGNTDDNEVENSAKVRNHEQNFSKVGLENIILMYNYLREAHQNAQPQVAQEPMEVTEDREDNKEHDHDNAMGSNNTDITKENQSLVATTIEAECKEAENRTSVVDNPVEGRVTIKKKKPEVATKNQIIKTTLVDSASQENLGYARQITDNRNIKNYVRDSIKKYKTPEHSTCLTPRFSNEELPNRNLRENSISTINITKETKECNKDKEMNDEYDEEELLKEPDDTSCPDGLIIESLLTDDED